MFYGKFCKTKGHLLLSVFLNLLGHRCRRLSRGLYDLELSQRFDEVNKQLRSYNPLR